MFVCVTDDKVERRNVGPQSICVCGSHVTMLKITFLVLFFSDLSLLHFTSKTLFSIIIFSIFVLCFADQIT